MDLAADSAHVGGLVAAGFVAGAVAVLAQVVEAPWDRMACLVGVLLGGTAADKACQEDRMGLLACLAA